MSPRSLLFVPGDRPDRMEKALSSDAEALILDLEDAVAPSAKQEARQHVRVFLEQYVSASKPIFVRINALGEKMLADDLDAIMPSAPFGIMLPKAEGAKDVEILDRALAGTQTRILPVVTETPRAIFQTGSYVEATSRLYGLTWGAEDLSSALGASKAREADGRYRGPYELARSLTLLGAKAANVMAFDTIFPSFHDRERLAAYVRRAREDGFAGMLAIHPLQIAIINDGFRPDPAEIERAARIVALFAANGGKGALSLDGEMLDAPHLAEARHLLERAGLTGTTDMHIANRLEETR